LSEGAGVAFLRLKNRQTGGISVLNEKSSKRGTMPLDERFRPARKKVRRGGNSARRRKESRKKLFTSVGKSLTEGNWGQASEEAAAPYEELENKKGEIAHPIH